MKDSKSEGSSIQRLPVPGIQRAGISETQESQLEQLPVPLQTEGLTSLRQLHRSGELLIKSMEKSLSSDVSASEIVEAAKALALTAQAKVMMVKALKEFLK